MKEKRHQFSYWDTKKEWGKEFYIDRLCHNMNDRRGTVLQTGNLKMIGYNGARRNG
jgi:hypothetical protein